MASCQEYTKQVGETMNTDPVADMFARITNAYAVGREKVHMPASRLKEEVARCLSRHGYVKKVEKKERALTLTLAYREKVPAVRGLKRVSKPGLRVYTGSRSLPKVLGGLGRAILTTPKGVLSDRECKKEGVGGEVVAYVW